MNDELDSEIFTCNRCGKKFDHTHGTWLPIGEEDKRVPLITNNEPVKVIEWGAWLKPPELITSDEFTCYDCL